MEKTSRRLTALLLALVLALSLCVPVFADGDTADTAGDAAKEGDAQLQRILQDTLAGVREKLPDPDYGCEWYLFDMARSGYLKKSDAYFYVYYRNLCAENGSFAKALAKAQQNGSPAGVLHSNKSTENSRVILALTAMGRDPRDVGGTDLLAPYTSQNFSWITRQGVNAAIWALLALDSLSYPTEDDFRQQCIDYILRDGCRTEDGGWDMAAIDKDGNRKKTGDPDVTAMALQALARYREQPAVETAVNQGLQVLSQLQQADGGYASYGYANSESISQVITACSLLGVDVRTDARFIKNGKTPVDALLTYYDSEEKVFRHSNDKDVQADADMPIQQAVYALTAYQRLLTGASSLYDMQDVAQDCADGQHTFGQWQETPATCTEAGFRSRSCTVCGRSEVEETAAATGHNPGTDYEMSDTAHWFPCAVCGAHIEEAAHSYTADQCRVCGYHKLGGRLVISTLTTVPESLQGISGMATFAGLQSRMLESAQRVDKDVRAVNSRMLDTALLIPSTGEDGKTVWTPAAKESFPADGRITVVLPYPAGTNRTDYEFVVIHTFTGDAFGKKTGGMESPRVKKTADGLQVTMTGLSPVMIAWTSGTDTTVERIARSVRTGDTSQMALWVCGVVVPAAAITLLVQRRKRSAS